MRQVVYPEMQQRMMDRARNKHRRVNAMRLMEENTSAFGNLLTFDGAKLEALLHACSVIWRCFVACALLWHLGSWDDLHTASGHLKHSADHSWQDCCGTMASALQSILPVICWPIAASPP